MNESMMDLTDLQDEIENAEEPTIAETGEEHHLRIISVGTGTSKSDEGKDRKWFSPVFEVIGAPMVKEFNTFFWQPDKENLTAKQYERALYSIQVFAASFDIDLSRPIDFNDDLPGKVGWAILGSKKDDEYGEKNTIRKFVAPK